jgi:hypothetical protein
MKCLVFGFCLIRGRWLYRAIKKAAENNILYRLVVIPSLVYHSIRNKEANTAPVPED